MELAQLANLGEFIGGVAVLATLVYLAIQVRQSTRQAAGGLQYAMLADHNRVLEATRADREHAALAVKAGNGERLDAIEEVQFRADVEVALNHWLGVQQAFDLGLIEESFFQMFSEDVSRTIEGNQAFRSYARGILGSYDDIEQTRIYAPIFREGADS